MKSAFYRLALSWADRCIRNNLYKCGHNIKDEQHVYCICIYISCICKNEYTKFVCTKSSGGGFLSNLNITLPRTFSISIYPIEGPPSLCSGNRRRWKEIGELPFFQALAWANLPKKMTCHLSHEGRKKKTTFLCMKSWLDNRDPYVGLWNNPYITRSYNPQNNPTNQVLPFFSWLIYQQDPKNQPLPLHRTEALANSPSHQQWIQEATAWYSAPTDPPKLDEPGRLWKKHPMTNFDLSRLFLTFMEFFWGGSTIYIYI